MSSLNLGARAPSMIPAVAPMLTASSAQSPIGLRRTLSWGLLAAAAPLLVTALAAVALVIWNASPHRVAIGDDQVSGILAQMAALGGLLSIGLVVLASRRAGWRAADYLAMTKPRGRYVLEGAVVLILSFGALIGLQLAGFETSSGDADVPKTIADLLLTGVSMAVVAPLWEELVFRGFLFRGIAESRVGVVGAIVLTSLIWALIHPDRTWIGTGELFFSGVLYGLLRWRSGSTTPSMAVHAINNSIVVGALAGMTFGWWS